MSYYYGAGTPAYVTSDKQGGYYTTAVPAGAMRPAGAMPSYPLPANPMASRTPPAAGMAPTPGTPTYGQPTPIAAHQMYPQTTAYAPAMINPAAYLSPTAMYQSYNGRTVIASSSPYMGGSQSAFTATVTSAQAMYGSPTMTIPTYGGYYALPPGYATAPMAAYQPGTMAGAYSPMIAHSPGMAPHMAAYPGATLMPYARPTM